MSTQNQGFSSIEGLVALTLLAIAALGSLASSAYALRTIREGSRAVRAARLLSSQTDRLRQSVRQAGGRCLPLTGGQLAGSHGEQLTWTASPAPGGRDLSLIVSFPTVRGQHSDTTAGFVACR